MVDFANGNLCGATIELNNVLTKLADAKAEIKSKLDDAASTATAAFLAKNNELAGLKDKLQTIVIPTVPKLNLQAEITSLLSQAPGSAAYAVALAKIASEFKTDIEAKGLTLETLVSTAAAASDLVCSVIPNLEKEAGSTVAAIEKPVAVKQAIEKAITEKPSIIWQNPDIESKVKLLADKTVNFKTTPIPPKADTAAFKIVPSSIIKTLTLGGAPGSTTPTGTAPTPTAPVVVAPTTSSERKNYVTEDKAAGFSYIKNTLFERFSISGDVGTKIESSGDNALLRLKHRPTGAGIKVWIYPGEHFSKRYIGANLRRAWGLSEESSDANRQFYYENMAGRHYAALILTHKYPHPRTNWFILDKAFIFSPPVELTDHPGNIDSGGSWSNPDLPDRFVCMGYEAFMQPNSIETQLRGVDNKKGDKLATGRRSDTKLNKKYKGVSVMIRYEYLEKYDPNYNVM